MIAALWPRRLSCKGKEPLVVDGTGSIAGFVGRCGQCRSPCGSGQMQHDVLVMPADGAEVIERTADPRFEFPACRLELPLAIEREGRVVPAACPPQQAFQARCPPVTKRFCLK